ncbi:MAG: hypothetical protein J0M23_05135 [Rickettsiales bacterium]|nr:hypothetical protein [Rickettsiales bacterium]
MPKSYVPTIWAKPRYVTDQENGLGHRTSRAYKGTRSSFYTGTLVHALLIAFAIKVC